MSPGIKYKHYAPKTKCILVYSKDNDKMVEKINELAQGKDIIVEGVEKDGLGLAIMNRLIRASAHEFIEI